METLGVFSRMHTVSSWCVCNSWFFFTLFSLKLYCILRGFYVRPTQGKLCSLISPYGQSCWKDVAGLLKNISKQTAWWRAGKTAKRSGRKMWRTKQYHKLDLAQFSQLSIKPQHKWKPYKHWPTSKLVSQDGTASMGRFTQICKLTFRDALCLTWLKLSFYHQTNREKFQSVDVKTGRERP